MNRRDFLRNCSYYLTATATMCSAGRAAFGSMFPNQNDGGSNDSDTMFPKGGPLTPIEVQPKQPVPGSSNFEGCTFSGDYANQFRFLRSSGDARIDQATFEEANYLAQVTGMQPSLAFLDDAQSKNAVAFKRDVISQRSRHGAVAMGVRLIQEFLKMPTPSPGMNALCIQAALVHEWAHIAQFNHGVQASSVKPMELMSDFIAGWYLGYKDAYVGRQSDPTSPMLCLASVGDTNFHDPAHHGTANERFGAYLAGFQFVTGGGGGGLGGGAQGGFFTSGGTYGGVGYGGGNGRGAEPPHFRAAFQYAEREVSGANPGSGLMRRLL